MESTMEAKISKLAESWSRSSRLDKLLVVIKTGKSFLTDLETLELGDVFSVLLILQKLAPKIKRCQREKFNVVLCFEASEAEAVKNWRDLSTVTYQQCDQLVSAVCRLNTFQSGKFIVVSEEPLVRLAAVFREKYAFQGLLPDDVAKYVDKVAMKVSAETHKIDVAPYVQLDKGCGLDEFMFTCTEKLHFPMFAKPQNGCASIGTAIISSEDELRLWLKQHWQDHSPFVLERLITGTEFTAYMFVQNDEISYMRIFKNEFPINWFIHRSKPVIKVEIPHCHQLYARLEAYSIRIASAWSPLQNGIFFIEFFLDEKSSSLVLMEVCCRLPGGLFPRALIESANIDIETLNLMASFKTVQIPCIYKPFIACFRFPRKRGTVVSLSDCSKLGLKSECHAKWRISVGDDLYDPRGLSGRHEALTIVLYNNDYDELLSDVNFLQNHFQPFQTC